MAKSMDDLLKTVLEDIDDDAVPVVTERTSEETTTFERLDKDKEQPPKKRSKPTLKKEFDNLDKHAKEATDGPEKDDKSKEGHPQPTRLPDDDGSEPPELHEPEPCNRPCDGWRPSYGHRRPWRPCYNNYRPHSYGRCGDGRCGGGRGHC